MNDAGTPRHAAMSSPHGLPDFARAKLVATRFSLRGGVMKVATGMAHPASPHATGDHVLAA